MLDAAFRARLDGPLDRAVVPLERLGIAPNTVTAVGFTIGVTACVAIANGQWWLGLALWLTNRLADGIDGPLARRQGATDLGGLLDILADFAIYGGVLVAIGIALPETRVACLVVLLTYYLSGSLFLVFSSLATKRQLEGDGRSLQFPTGIAEGTETIASYVAILVFPAAAEVLLWIWAVLVAITVLQRLVIISRLLR
ncbi:MAG: CDP-alcohol phosphatidyltransferase family protein [Acidimicrobiales bacterium]|jgi:phosphatidylglycerophosphate synthase|tara:strand:- start:17 stop:610 length:594 start_codon:yes stop_codon:yes gene_type:complete